MIRLEQRQLDAAIQAYEKALATDNTTPEQEVGLHYDLGYAHQLRGDVEEAIGHFEKVERRDPSYRHVKERLQELRNRARSPSSARSVNGDDELDQVFDDLFDSS